MCVFIFGGGVGDWIISKSYIRMKTRNIIPFVLHKMNSSTFDEESDVKERVDEESLAINHQVTVRL